MKGTDIYYLSGIYRNSNSMPTIGATADDEQRYAVWVGNRNNLSPGKLSLYARLDYLIELAGITTDTKELSDMLNEMDMISLALRAYDHVDAHPGELEKFYYIIASMVRLGELRSNNVDLGFRQENLAVLERDMLFRYKNKNYDSAIVDTDVLAWLTKEVLHRLSAPAISGVFDLASAQRMERMQKQGGMYYIYTFIPESFAARESASVQRKRHAQFRTLRWQEQADIWHNYEASRNLIRAGIIVRTGMTPERWLNNARRNPARVGAITVTTVIAIAAIVIELIKLIVSIFGKKKESAPTESQIRQSLADTLQDGFSTQGQSGNAGNGGNSGNAGGGNTSSASSGFLRAGLAGSGILIPLLLAGMALVSKNKAE